ncbi:MAG: PEP-CTERM sorting domain-containing protein [Candidatus Udaeobacter sp.]
MKASRTTKSIARGVATALVATLVWQSSVEAQPITIHRVVLILDRYQNPSRVDVDQESAHPAPSGSSLQRQATQTKPLDTRSLSLISIEGSSLSAINLSSVPQNPVSVIQQGDIEGTICDCGEIIIPAGGFPKWPLLFLGAIPLFFISHDTKPSALPVVLPTTPGSSPTPSGSIPQVPEPSSVWFFLGGLAVLAIFWRRRIRLHEVRVSTK